MNTVGNQIDAKDSVLVMFHRIGPYHLARLRGAAAAVPDKTIIGLEGADGDEIYAWDAVESAGIRKVTAFQGIDSGKMSRNDLLVRFRDVFRQESPIALFILGWTHLGIAGLIAAKEQSIPVVLMSESSARDFYRNPIKEWIKRRVLRGCSAGLVGAESHRDYLISLGLKKEQIATGYDAVDNDYFANEADRHRRAAESFKKQYQIERPFFLASNRFIPKKNIDTLYRAYAQYHAEAGSDAWDLVCLGDGELKEELNQLRRDLNMQSNIHTPGFIQYKELPRFYAMAECFVHVSFREQWGLVVNEAMACGLPVMVSEPCGSAELIDQGKNGWIIDPDSEDSISDCMLEITNMTKAQREQMGQFSRTTIAGFGLEQFGAGFSQALTVALSVPPKRPSMLDRLTWRFALSRL
ncbi:glycosyltransferase family 4 protein [Novipirellula sp.]|uniref:glycosyltransferase family 4 protein n=1 Tax=Novipirellula sp. TaxID=2795430 RepID=UPI00356678C5